MITHFDKYELKGTIKIVQHHEVEALTSSGWKLLALLSTQDERATFTEYPNPALANESYAAPTVSCVSGAVVVNTPLFMMQRTEAVDAIAEVTAALKELEAKLERADGYKEALKKEVFALKDEAVVHKYRLEEEHDNKIWLNDRLRTMERDISKIRKHFGDKAMNEALADHPAA